MSNQDLRAKGISELRAMAKKAGIAVKKDWKKADFIKALSAKKAKKAKVKKKVSSAKRPARKVPAKKKAAVKTARKATPVKKAKPKPKKAPARKAAAAPARGLTAKPMEQLTVPELRKLAEGLGIPLTGKTRKADIIAAFRSAKPEKKAPPKKALPKKAEEKPAPKKEKPVPVKKAAAPVKKKIVVAAPEREGVEVVEAGEAAPLAESQAIEYDGDKVMSMPVAPRRLYVYWELSEETALKYRGSLNLKVLDIKTNSFFYMPISERIGEYFINVSPEGEYSIEVGRINYKGEFINLVQLVPAESPGAGGEEEAKEGGPSEEGGLPEEFFRIPGTASSY